jgi:hypothetical protein
MLRLRPTSALVVLLAATTVASGQTDPGLWRFLHPDAKALISIDWRRVRQSQIGIAMREKWLAQGGFATAVPGSEFLDDIDRFLISSAGRNAADEKSEPALLVVASGHFDLTKVRELLAGHGVKPQMFNSTQVYRPQGANAKDLAIVLLNAQTILVGDSHSVFAAVERNAFPAAPPDPGSLLARAVAAESSYDVWMYMTAPDTLGSERLTSLFTGGWLAPDARSFEVGIALRSGMAADVAVQFASEADAKKLVSEFGKFLKVAVKDKTVAAGMLEFEKKLKVTSEGSTARISLRLTQQELEKGTKNFAAARKQPAAGSLDLRPLVHATPAPPKAVPPEAEKKVIRIEGLDEGAREIPFKEH